MLKKDIEMFKNRRVKAKEIFYIKEISKPVAYEFVRKYHYLADAKFFAVQSFGLYHKRTRQLIGVATYSLPQGIVTLKSWFSLDNSTKNIYELSRLCMLPNLNGTNATSYLLGGSIKLLKQQKFVRAIITLACSERHVGSIYQVCNFTYYGLSDSKTDFYCEDGKLNPRGSTKSMRGVWLPRAKKHRYAYILDPTLKCNYQECERPTIDETIELECCNGTHKVYDTGFGVWYTCPRCTGELKILEELENGSRKAI